MNVEQRRAEAELHIIIVASSASTPAVINAVQRGDVFKSLIYQRPFRSLHTFSTLNGPHSHKTPAQAPGLMTLNG